MEASHPENSCSRLIREESAVSGTEYAIMLALIALGSMVTIGIIGSKFEILYTIIAEGLPDALG